MPPIKPSRPKQVAKSIRMWTDVFRGQPAFLLGNGPSIGDLDLTEVQKYFTIGINRSFFLFDPVMLMWQDQSLMDSEGEKVLQLTALKVCRDSVDLQRRFCRFALKGQSGYRLASSPHILYGKGSTGPLAFQMAYAMGCDPIIMLGYDCCQRGENTDFYGHNPYHKIHTMSNCRKGLVWMHSLDIKRQVINCSDNDVWDHRSDLKKVIKSLPEPKGRDFYINQLSRLVYN